ncbi:hypothetical protein BZG36_02923 [Bifiguratus adelaidae]|uniref:VOC domain-containing protein n=1 Tax=Bifiguratus adelaidae TaxID=1938954 RepID=A0A261Y1F1_9FUNG|nr:hypothetical protein BZG36_02923 [Bifiguratus adelaidae]
MAPAVQLTNRYTAVPDIVAAKGAGQNIAEFKKEFALDEENQVRLVKISHMRYQHPDLAEITQFLQDFGMVVAKQTEDKVWYRGYSTDQYVHYAQEGPRKFLGGTFEVQSFADLEMAANLPGATTIEELTDTPGGGHIVTVTDPARFPVNFIHGQTPVQGGDVPPKLIVNYEQEKPRKRAFQRFEPGPAAVHKLGHFGLCVTDFSSQLDFYITNFNIIPRDFLYVEEDGQKRKVAVFAYIDRGEDYVDHHTFFLGTAGSNHVHHCFFEVHDFDTQELASKGYKSVWGVGRHILGSQIFDYWWDTTGNMIEHYADGDLVNDQTPINFEPAGDESLAVWGTRVAQSILGLNVSPSFLVRAQTGR